MAPQNRVPRLGKASDVCRALITITHMLNLMVEQPFHISELVPPELPHFYGNVDYAACWMGGTLLPCTRWVQPIIWRVKNPAYIELQTCLRQGSISNSDREAAAVFVQELSMEA